jgi:DnaK suppressor protein
MSLEYPNPHKIRELLQARRTTLLARYQGALERTAEELATPERDPLDTASEQWDARVVSMVSDADARTLERVADALERLDAGSYGICLMCGDLIEPARLRALPEAAECVDCVRFAEDTPPQSVISIGDR